MSKRASRKPRVILVVVSLVLLVLLVPFSSALANGSAADATNGQALFAANCASCHGASASGGKVGTTDVPDVRWGAIGSTFKNDPALVQRAILKGLDESGQPLDAVMPRFGDTGKLTDAQAADIVAYLQTLTGGLPKTGDPIDATALLGIALAGGALVLGGIKLRQAAR